MRQNNIEKKSYPGVDHKYYRKVILKVYNKKERECTFHVQCIAKCFASEIT